MESFYWKTFVEPHLRLCASLSGSAEDLSILADIVGSDDLLGYIFSFLDTDEFFRFRLACKRMISTKWLRHAYALRLTGTSKHSPKAIALITELSSKYTEHLTGLRCIDWYLPLELAGHDNIKKFFATVVPQVEYFNGKVESLFNCVNPKIIKHMSINPGNMPQRFISGMKFDRVEFLSIRTDSDDYAADFVTSLKSLVNLHIWTTQEPGDLALPVLLQSIRAIARSNRNLKRLDFDISYGDENYRVASLLLLGTMSEDVFPAKMEQLNQLFESNLGISPGMLTLYGSSVWKIFYIEGPATQMAQAAAVKSWRTLFDQCYETTHEKFVQLGHFAVRLHDPELQATNFEIGDYLVEMEKTLDELLEQEKQWCPLLNTVDIACAVLSWGGSMLLRYPDDPAIRQHVQAKCCLTLENMPRLLPACSESLDVTDIRSVICPALHCVLELGAQWFDPTTRIIKNEYRDDLRAQAPLLIAMAAHQKFNADVMLNEDQYLCQFMLQTLLEEWIEPNIPDYEDYLTNLAKMCYERKARIRVTSNFVRTKFIFRGSEDILDIFSALFDDIGRICDHKPMRSVRWDDLFRSLAVMLDKIQQRGDHTLEQIERYRIRISTAIWRELRIDENNFSRPKSQGRWIEYLFDIWPQLPSVAVEFLEEENKGSSRRRRLVTDAMWKVDRLRARLPPRAYKYAASNQGN